MSRTCAGLPKSVKLRSAEARRSEGKPNDKRSEMRRLPERKQFQEAKLRSAEARLEARPHAGFALQSSVNRKFLMSFCEFRTACESSS